MGRSRMALEVGTHSPWISRELAEMVRLTEGLSEATREVVACAFFHSGFAAANRAFPFAVSANSRTRRSVPTFASTQPFRPSCYKLRETVVLSKT